MLVPQLLKENIFSDVTFTPEFRSFPTADQGMTLETVKGDEDDVDDDDDEVRPDEGAFEADMDEDDAAAPPSSE